MQPNSRPEEKCIPDLFSGFVDLPDAEHMAALVYGSNKNRSHMGSGRIVLIKEPMTEIRGIRSKRKVRNAAVPEQYTILRGMQFAANFWTNKYGEENNRRLLPPR